MKWIRLYIVMGAMAISLIGLILLQYFWIRNLLQTNRVEFEQQMTRSVQRITEKNQACEMLHCLNSKGKKTVPCAVSCQNKGIRPCNCACCVRDSENNKDLGKTAFHWQKTQNESVLGDGQSFTHQNEDVESFVFSLGELQEKQPKKEKIIKQVMVELLDYEAPSLDSARLDSIICAEFQAHNRECKYAFCVYNPNNEPIIKQIPTTFTPKPENQFSAPLYPDAYLKPNARLAVFVSDPGDLLLSQILWSLIASAGFLFVVIGSFSYTIFLIFKQKKLSDMKNDFINNITHELKTPITTISLASEALLESSSEVKQNHRFARIIYDENQRLEKQVQQILKLAELERGDIKLDLQDCNIQLLIEQTIQSFALQIEARNGKISFQNLTAQNVHCYVDNSQFCNVFYNLIDNAIKYSPNELDITITAYKSNHSLYISVADKGLGINAEHSKHIFDKFYRVPTGNVHDVKGFGIGLAYVKEIIELHQGNIQVQSQLNKGSTFTIQLPLSQ